LQLGIDIHFVTSIVSKPEICTYDTHLVVWKMFHSNSTTSPATLQHFSHKLSQISLIMIQQERFFHDHLFLSFDYFIFQFTFIESPIRCLSKIYLWILAVIGKPKFWWIIPPSAHLLKTNTIQTLCMYLRSTKLSTMEPNYISCDNSGSSELEE
jgi:hypothetical protein